ncbi:MAG: M48 family metallopeptidase [Thermoguttaceae bacterium]
MAIRVSCSNCNRQFKVADSLAGKRGKCPGCEALLQVPMGTETASRPSGQGPGGEPKASRTSPGLGRAVAAGAVVGSRPGVVEPLPSAAVAQEIAPSAQPRPYSRQELQGMILQGLGGRIDDVELTGNYHAGLVVVACVMMAMVVAYLLLLAGAVGFIVWYVKFALDAFGSTGATESVVFLALVLLVPLVMVVLTLAALVRPLFDRLDRQERTRTLTRQSDPLLYAFVERIAAAIGAPTPSRIDVTTDVNASAGFRGGMFSASGSELVLTIGLSLVAGLNTRQFAGVLAHELGHFTQDSSIRLTSLVMRISSWFWRAADRGYWDAQFSRLARAADGRFLMVAVLMRLVMKVPQWIFRGLLMVAYLACGYMFRQHELDADRFETRVGGSDCFESTTRRLEVLQLAYQGAIGDLEYGHGEGRLGDNLPLLVLSNARQLPEKVHRALKTHVDESQTGLFDSHPSPRARIENARQEQSAGIYRVELPAHLLFSNFLGLTRSATWDFYRGIFGPKFQQSEMHPTGDLLERIEQEEQAYKTVRRFYQGTFTARRPIRLRGSSVEAPADPAAAVAALKEARQAAMATVEAHRALVKKYNQADTRIVEATQARALYRVGRRVRNGDFSVAMRNIDEVNDVLRRAHAQINGSCRDLVRYEEVFSVRLWSALQLMHVPRVAERMGNPRKLEEECHKLVDALGFLNTNAEDMLHLRNSHMALYALFTQFRGHFRDKHLINEIVSETKDVYQRLVRLRQSLATMVYPFDHAKGRITMADYALPQMPDHENPIEIYDATRQFGSAMTAFYPRLAGRLAMMAEKVESLLGLEPLPEPPEEQEDAEGEGR